MLHEILLAMQGFPGDVIRPMPPHAPQTFAIAAPTGADVDPHALFHPAECAEINALAALGWHATQIRHWCAAVRAEYTRGLHRHVAQRSPGKDGTADSAMAMDPPEADRAAPPSLYRLAVATALESHLDAYTAALVACEADLLDPRRALASLGERTPLAHLAARFAAYAVTLPAAAAWCRAWSAAAGPAAGAPLRGIPLMNAVHARTAHGDPRLARLAGLLVRACHAVFARQLRAWLCDGVLRDPFDEFLIAATAAHAAQDAFAGADADATQGYSVVDAATVWQDAYTLRVSAPAELPWMLDRQGAETVLFVGKTRILLAARHRGTAALPVLPDHIMPAACAPIAELVAAIAPPPLAKRDAGGGDRDVDADAPISTALVADRLGACRAAAAAQLLALLSAVDGLLPSSFQALRTVFLGGAGGVLAAFADALAPLQRRARAHLTHITQYEVTSAWQQSLEDAWPAFARDGADSDPAVAQHHAEGFRPHHFTLTLLAANADLTREGDGVAMINGLAFRLDVAPPWPLHALLSRHHIQTYQVLFARLTRLARLEASLVALTLRATKEGMAAGRVNAAHAVAAAAAATGAGDGRSSASASASLSRQARRIGAASAHWRAPTTATLARLRRLLLFVRTLHHYFQMHVVEDAHAAFMARLADVHAAPAAAPGLPDVAAPASHGAGHGIEAFEAVERAHAVLLARLTRGFFLDLPAHARALDAALEAAEDVVRRTASPHDDAAGHPTAPPPRYANPHRIAEPEAMAVDQRGDPLPSATPLPAIGPASLFAFEAAIAQLYMLATAGERPRGAEGPLEGLRAAGQAVEGLRHKGPEALLTALDYNGFLTASILRHGADALAMKAA
ncbi:hypothetical protein CXG81DRAFT_18232 [Caulochytrium protostelioides]|uniref:Spindle pole body component n=1 Tax=Caulochytrium protostelioides TaxID=1555241 RepID=A0A4V1IUX3_9FUNG|nr:hypothetical protein CXG81DRAFT_18232 [Caulochytrium protostelioides]|eukprot:RKP02059.1 hypothetical protein CXG81DRAFT_18232 [Caulochytrium protostelioides]